MLLSFFFKFLLLLSINFCLSERNMKLERRISGGQYSKAHEDRQTAFLRAYCRQGYWSCGSTIVNQYIAMSAAHCLMGCDRRFDVEVYAGHTNIKEAKVRRKTGTFIIHESYNERNSFADVGLILVRRAFPLGENIKRIIIRPTFPGDSEGWVSGWGVMNVVTRESPINLKRVKVKIFPSKNCDRVVNMKEGMFCATSGHKNHHPNRGDSGGPFMSKDFQQIGLVSHRGLKSPHMIVFTNISTYYSWIKTTNEKLLCKNK